MCPAQSRRRSATHHAELLCSSLTSDIQEALLPKGPENVKKIPKVYDAKLNKCISEMIPKPPLAEANCIRKTKIRSLERGYLFFFLSYLG